MHQDNRVTTDSLDNAKHDAELRYKGNYDTPHQNINSLEAGVMILFLSCITCLLLSLARNKLLHFIKNKQHILINTSIVNLAYASLFLLTLFCVLRLTGIHTYPILITYAFFALISVMALRNLIANAAYGIMLNKKNIIKTGNKLDVDGLIGTVEQLGFFGFFLQIPEGKKAYLSYEYILTKEISVLSSG